MNRKISVIVPIYNTSRFLESCIRSIIGQTYRNIEVLLIDDGSTDDSLAKCNEYANWDDRIRVLAQAHRGIAEARNAGLTAAAGEYISFVDSDDTISPHMLQDMMEKGTDYDADIVECSMKVMRETDSGDSAPGLYEPSELIALDHLGGIKNFLLKKIQPSCCNKLFKKERMGELKFRSIHRLEEYCFTWELVEKSQNYVFLPNQYYYYCLLRPDSITQSDHSKSIMNYVEFSQFLETHIRIHYPGQIKEAEYYSYATCLDILRALSGQLLNDKCNQQDELVLKHELKYLLNMKNAYENVGNPYIQNTMKQKGE